MEEIKQKVQDLELALNYVCYDADLIPKLSKVWEKLELLQEAVNKTCNIPHVSIFVCPDCKGSNMVESNKREVWCNDCKKNFRESEC